MSLYPPDCEPGPTEGRVIRRFDSLSRVASDAEAFSIASTDASSIATTVYGLGSTAGHGLMVLGEWMVRGAGTITAELRLQAALSNLNSPRDRPWARRIDDVRTLLEYQRIHIYPDAVRGRAWAGIFVVLHKNWFLLRAALATWPDVEVQLFLRQLALCRMSQWTRSAVEGYPGALSDSLSSLRYTLSENHCYVLWALSSTKFSLLQHTFSWEYVTLLLCNSLPAGNPPYVQDKERTAAAGTRADTRQELESDAALAVFLNSWASWPYLTVANDLRPSARSGFNTGQQHLRELSPQMELFAHMTSHPKASQWAQRVVSYCVRALFSDTSGPEGGGDFSSTDWLLLSLVAVLCSRSKQVAGQFRQAGICSVVEKIEFPGLRRSQFELHPPWTRQMVCHLVLRPLKDRTVSMPLRRMRLPTILPHGDVGDL